MVKRLFLIALFIILIDRITKVFFSKYNFWIFRYSLNKGAAFSILQDWNLFLILVGIVVIFLIIYYRNVKSRNLQISLGLLLGGTIGNLVDRIFYKGVIDFVSVSIFPVFNLADIANFIGGLILVIYFIKK